MRSNYGTSKSIKIAIYLVLCRKDFAMKQKKRKIILGIILFFLMMIFGIIFYLNQYYHSDDSVQDFLISDESVMIDKQKDFITFNPKNSSEDAIIFYPGAKVEFTAYAPLMKQLAQSGITCYLMKMPCNLAVLSPDKADLILKEKRELHKNWYIGGHSLGGAMASNYVYKHQNEFKGLILLGAYSTKDLSSTHLSVLSLYGSNDQVLNFEKYKEYKKNLPSSTIEFVIQGGNHANYGNYGIQKGDGIATISQEEQQQISLEQILNFINS